MDSLVGRLTFRWTVCLVVDRDGAVAASLFSAWHSIYHIHSNTEISVYSAFRSCEHF